MWSIRIAVFLVSCQVVLGAASVADYQVEEIRKGARRIVLGTEYPPCADPCNQGTVETRWKTEPDAVCAILEPSKPNALKRGDCIKMVCANGYYWTFGGWSPRQECVSSTILPPNPLCPAGHGCVQP